MGMFSYPVDEFTWEHVAPGKGTTLSTRLFRERGFDLIFHEDGGAWSEYRGGAIPLVYYAIDSTLSQEHHYLPRLEQARKADLVLVDHDRLDRFTAIHKPVRRLSYCVNDHLFQPVDKTLDVDFQCGGSPERGVMRVKLSEMARRHQLSYVSGAVSLQDYACNLNRAKVVVNLPRTATNRPHRVFDALAAGACLVSTALVDVSGEDRRASVHYLEAAADSIPDLVPKLIQTGSWIDTAQAGYRWVQQHTWKTRAQQLRALIQEIFGI